MKFFLSLALLALGFLPLQANAQDLLYSGIVGHVQGFQDSDHPLNSGDSVYVYLSSGEELSLKFVSPGGASGPAIKLCQDGPYTRTRRELSADAVHYNYSFTNGDLSLYGCLISVEVAHAPSSNLGSLSLTKTNDRRQIEMLTARLEPNPFPSSD